MPRYQTRLSRVFRLARAVPLALLLVVLVLVPVAGRAAAQPGTHNTPPAPASKRIGFSSQPNMYLSLHYDSAFAHAPQGQSEPTFMSTDAQANLYVSDIKTNQVYMYDTGGFNAHTYGTGNTGTNPGDIAAPGGVVVSGNTVFVADQGHHLIQTFDKNTGNWISSFGGQPQIGSPGDLALGSNGQLYIADYANNRIVRLSTNGAPLGTFGGPGSGNGQFNHPIGIAASSLGFIYVVDNGNHRVEQFNLNGAYVNQWGSASFTYPTGIAVDRANMVYVVDQGASFTSVDKFDSGGAFVGSYNGPLGPNPPGFTPGLFYSPYDVAVRTQPNNPIVVFVSDYFAGTVQRFDQVSTPQIHTYQAQWGGSGSGNGQFSGPRGLTVDRAGNVYVADTGNNRIEKFDQSGNFEFAFGGTGSGNGQFSAPWSVAVTPDGTKVFVSDSNNNRIEIFNASGGYLGQFGGPGAGDGQFNGPEGLATDGTLVYVADFGNDRVQLFFAANGGFVSAFGSKGTGNGQFEGPSDITVDSNLGALFVADPFNNRVQILNGAGTFLGVIVSAAAVGLNTPESVTTDQRGDVYIADTGHSRAAVVTYPALISTAIGGAGAGNGQFFAPIGLAVSPASGQLYIADQALSRVQRFGAPWSKQDTVGVYRPSTHTFYLRNSNSTGPADIVVPMSYALNGDIPVVGDWNGDGVDTVGLYRSSTGVFLLQDSNAPESAPDYVFALGTTGDEPIAGDWNGVGSDHAGVFRPSNGIIYLRNNLSTGNADYSMVLGVNGDQGVAGDWNGDGQDSPGVYRPSNQTFYLSDKVTNGVVFSDHTAMLGISGDAPFTGDWVAQGSSGIGVFRPSNGITYEKNVPTTGNADNFFTYGIAGDIPVAGQWIAQRLSFPKPPHGPTGAPGSAPHPAGRGSQPVAQTSATAAAKPHRAAAR